MLGFGSKRRRGATPLRRSSRSTGQSWRVWATPLRWAGVALVLAGVGFGLWVGSQKLRDPAAFPLRQVRIEGVLRNLAESDLQPVASNYLGQNFFMANLEALRTALATNPWIDTVAVRRSWPETVTITLREREAFGYWGEGEQEMVDVEGRRFRPEVVRQSGPWPHLAGPVGHEAALIRTWGELQALFNPVGLQLTRLTQDERRAWRLSFANGLEVYVGRDQFEARLRRLAQLYPRVLAGQIDQIAAVALRYGNGFAVRWKTAAPPPTAG
ncbi:MAG: cell division protein FtsQ/DivIB [Candidatus Contendobacter sp.]|nr:cell division protein FtsQ/DivIB [Candidatus Contendobacter sp.]